MAASGLPRREARALLAGLLGRRREWIIAHGDAPMPAAEAPAYTALCTRRLRGEPMAYLLGSREFRGHTFRVTPDVLIPRPETEALVQWVIDHAPTGSRVLDLGTGSGAIAVSVAIERPDLTVAATDASEAALTVARGNAAAHGVRIAFHAGSWWHALPAGTRWPLVVSNPPYIAHNDAHLAAGDLRFEPPMALASGVDGLDAIRQILAGAAGHLAPGGLLALEHGYDQAEAVAALLARHGFENRWHQQDDQGQPRLSGGQFHTDTGVD